MSSNTSKKSNRINIKNAVYAVLQSDDTTGATYGTVKSLAKAMTVTVTPSQATGVLYGDGVQQENLAKITGMAVKFEGNKIPIEDKAIIQGHAYSGGVMVTNKADEAPYIAFGYIIEGTNKYAEYVWLLKGRCEEAAHTDNQSNDKINFGSDNITINFLPRESDGNLRYYGDTANADLTAEMAAKWFATGPVAPVTA